MAVTRRARPTPVRTRESLRPPRYRLLAAAAAIPQRAPELPTETFGADCPACGREVAFTQLHGDAGVEYSIEDHDCR